jgi:hypothetical protein
MDASMLDGRGMQQAAAIHHPSAAISRSNVKYLYHKVLSIFSQ